MPKGAAAAPSMFSSSYDGRRRRAGRDGGRGIGQARARRAARRAPGARRRAEGRRQVQRAARCPRRETASAPALENGTANMAAVRVAVARPAARLPLLLLCKREGMFQQTHAARRSCAR